MTLKETAHRAYQTSTSGTIVLADDNRVPFDAVRSYRDHNGAFTITVAAAKEEKAYHSDQIKAIELDDV